MILRQLLLFFLFAVSTVAMATPDSQELSVEIGFDGIVRAGHWNPVMLHIPHGSYVKQVRMTRTSCRLGVTEPFKRLYRAI